MYYINNETHTSGIQVNYITLITEDLQEYEKLILYPKYHIRTRNGQQKRYLNKEALILEEIKEKNTEVYESKNFFVKLSDNCKKIGMVKTKSNDDYEIVTTGILNRELMLSAVQSFKPKN